MSDFKIFKYSILILEHHLDTFGHVNNATYLQLLEEARWDFLHAHGLDLKTIQKSNIGPVVLECHIKFLKELMLRENIVIESQILSYEKKIGVIRQIIINDKGSICTEAKLIFGFFDMTERKLITPTPPILRAIGIEN